MRKITRSLAHSSDSEGIAASSPMPSIQTSVCRTSSRTLMLAVMFAVPLAVQAQVITPGNQTGLPIFGTRNGSEFDSVSMQDGKLHIDIPLISVPGRKGVAHWDFIYNTPSWQAAFWLVDGANSGDVAPVVDSSMGWSLNNDLYWNLNWVQGGAQCDPQYNQDGTFADYGVKHNYFHDFVLVDPNGTKHPLSIQWEAGGVSASCPGYGTISKGYTLDGSGILVDISGWDSNTPNELTQTRVTLKDGSHITLGPSSQRDSNGNFLSGATDTLGRSLLSISSGPSITYTTPLGMTMTAPAYSLLGIRDSNGNAQTFRLDSQLIDIRTDGCNSALGSAGPCQEDTSPQLVPRKLTLPDGLAYVFTYANAGYADLTSIDLPSGGSINYTYVHSRCCQVSTPNPGSPSGTGSCSIQSGCGGGGVTQGGQTTIFSLYSSVASRTVTNSDGTSATWSYPAPDTVVDPLGNKEVHTNAFLTANPGSVPTVLTSVPYETDVQTFDPNGKLLRTVHKDYALEAGITDNSPLGTLEAIDVRLIRETTTLENGLVSKKETDFESVAQLGAGPNATFLNPTEIREYDFGQGAPGPLIRRTDYTYLHTNNPTYLNLNIVDRPASVFVYDGSGNIEAQTKYEYDNYTAGIQASNAVQHDSTFSTSYTTRGNLTATSKWRNTDGAWLTTRNQYDDAGNIVSTKDPLGHTTSYDYTDSWTNSSCAPSGQGKAYVTKITNALGQITTKSYNSCPGTLASSTDPNGLTTSTTYDLMNRPVTVNFPDGGNTINCYSDLGGSKCSQSGPPLQITTTQAINTAASKTTISYYDGLGRLSETALTSDNEGADYTFTTYDPLGRVSRVYNPTRCNPPTTNCGESTWGYSTTSYDALDRTIGVTKQDGSVLSTAYSGNSTTVTDEAGRQRRSFTDGLGRLIEVDEPSGAAAASGTGSATVNGSEQSIAGVTAVSGSGSATVNGSEQSIPAVAAISGSASVTISGSEQSISSQQCVAYDFTDGCVQWQTNTTYDSGTITITVNGFSRSVSYGSTSTPASIASALASALNNASGTPVRATASGALVSIVSIATGTASNYSFSSSYSTNDPAHFSPSFGTSPLSGAFSGGKNAIPAVYDSGSAWVTINGTQYSVSYGQGSSTSSVASALASAISAGSFTNATASGAGITITAKATGASTDYSLSSGSSTSQSGSFSSPSFSISVSGGSLTGGVDGKAAIYDSGSVWVSVNGIQATATYGQGDTGATVAQRLQSNMGSWPVTISLSGSSLALTAKGTGSATNYAVSGGSSTSQTGSFTQPSFTVSVSGLSGGSDAIYSLSTPAVTLYSYDALGNLTSVVQNGSHQRTFTYDSLSHLLTSTNPETGAICYGTVSAGQCQNNGYDADGNLVAKTDARGITTTYAYDALNRETSRTYSNGDPAIATHYDEANCLGLPQCANIGHRTSMTDAAGSESWSFDVPDRMHRDQRTTNGISKTTTYNFDLAGNITSVTYPTGRVVNYTFDAASRPATAADGSNGITYATGMQSPPSGCSSIAACYTPQGAFYALSIGQSSSFTGLNLTHHYNNRLQPLEFQASSTGGSAIDVSYSFVDPVSGGNAGHVFSIANNLNSSRSQSFSYDQLNRITNAGTSATTGTYCWGYQFGYDAWGNLLYQQGWAPNYTGCSEPTMSPVTVDGNNHISAFAYDASGNATGDGAFAYTWDAESQMKTAAGVTYTYDGDGRRVMKSNGKMYWYGSGGEILAETDAAGNTLNEYIFFGGQRIAMLPSGSSPLYYVEDFLGTSRVITDSSGVPCYDADFDPFGGEHAYTNTCPQNYKFEGKERDTETGNDDFGARYYSNRYGRWLSADWSAVPVPVPYANLTNPQTLNLYSMVSDDPESFADLDGHCCDWDDVVSAIKVVDQAYTATQYAIGAMKAGPMGGSPSNEMQKDAYNLTTQVLIQAPWVIMSVGGAKASPGEPLVEGTPSEPGITSEPGASGSEPTATPEAKPGEVYVTEPQKESGNPYVGRTTQGTDKRMQTRTDGRTGKATTIDTYKTTEEGRYKEQKAMDDRGGRQNLDNKRNEVNSRRMQELKKKYDKKADGPGQN